MSSLLRSFFSLLIMAFVLSACGVETDSSSKTNTIDTGIDNDDSIDDNNTDDDNTDDDNTDDDNTDDDNTDDDNTDDDVEPNEDQENSDYDTRGATLDPNACRITDLYKNTMLHTSFDFVRQVDNTNGLEIGSEYAPPINGDITLTNVALFYPDMVSTRSCNPDVLNPAPCDMRTIRVANKYVLSYDVNWPANTNRTVYIRTPKVEENNGYFGCYRYNLSSTDTTSVQAEKVYRLKQ